MKTQKRFLGSLLAVSVLISGLFPGGLMQASATKTEAAPSTVIDVTDFGADPSGKSDSTEAVKAALEAAKEADGDVTVNFPTGEYHFWKDYATKKVYHTSNTGSLSYPEKYIGILLEGMDHVTLEGNDSSLIMHGDMMALAVVDSTDIQVQNFVLDYKDPDTVDISVVGNGVDDNGKQYTDFYVPANYNYTIQESGTGITWQGEISPVTGKPYWEKNSADFCVMLVIYKGYDQTVARASNKAASNPFSGVRSIEKVGENVLRFTYNGNRPQDQEEGNIFLLSDSATRKTTGAFFWESENLLVDEIDVHYLSGFGWLTQMCKDVEFRGVDFLPRYGTGKYTTSNADQLHVAGCGGYFKVTDCNFSMAHDDPINVHGSYMRVEQVIDERTLMVKYIHGQQGGFRQFHPGDEVLFYSRTYLEPPAGEDESKPYVVESSIAPGETYQGEKLDMRTEVVTFQEPFSQETLDDLRIQVTRNGSSEKEGLYVAENVSYTPAVTISGNHMKSIPTRGILCTTRQPVIIENNIFDNMAMANIYLSNDANYWYESGPIRNMIIRNNDFYIRPTGQAEWGSVSGVFVDPVVLTGVQNAPPSKGSIPVHRNITIEGNRFYMANDNVVTANGVDGMKILNNTVIRDNANLQVTLDSVKQLDVGQSVDLHGQVSETTLPKDVFKFTNCQNVVIEGNTYDNGLNLNVTTAGDRMSEDDVTIKDEELTLNQSGGNLVTSGDHIRYVTSNPEVAYVNEHGQLVGVSEGTVELTAYVEWNGALAQSQGITVTVGHDTASPVELSADRTEITEENGTASLTYTEGATLSLVDPLTGQPSNAATLDNGTYTARTEGVVLVTAEKDGSSTSLLMVHRFPNSYGNPEYLADESVSIDELNASHLSGSRTSVEITAQTGSELYLGDTTVINLVKFRIPDEYKNDLRIQVDAQGLPVRGDAYNNAGILLYKDGNNYYSMGKKGHLDGVTAVYEENAAPQERPGSSADNQLTDTTFEIEIQNGTATMRFKNSAGQWVTANSQDNIGVLTDGDVYLALCAWINEGGNFRTTFDHIRIAKASQTTSENMGDTPDCEIFGSFSNQAPTVSKPELTVGSVNQEARVEAQTADSDGTVSQTIYQWTLTEEQGETVVYTADPVYTPTRPGTLQVQVVALDEYGKPSSVASSEPKSISYSTQGGDELSTLYINGNPVTDFGSEDASFLLPADASDHIRVSYPMGSANVPTVLRDGHGTQLAEIQSGNNAAVIATPEVLQIQQGQITYTVRIVKQQERNVQIDSLSVDDTAINLDEDAIRTGTDSYFLAVEKDDVTLDLRTNDPNATVSAVRSFFRIPVDNQAQQTGRFSALVDLTAGINAFELTVLGSDQVSQRTIRLYLFRDGHNNSNLEGLKINGTLLEDFAPDQYEYTVYLEGASQLTLEAVQGAAEQSTSFTKDCTRTDGTRAEYEIHSGLNQIVVANRSENMWTTSYYTVNVVVTAPDNADLMALTADQALSPAFDALKPDVTQYSMDIHKAVLHLHAQALMDNATLRIFSDTQEFQGTEQVDADLQMYEGSNTVCIEVTAPDGTTVKTYTLHINASGLEYASDRMDLATKQEVGYDTLKLDRSSSGGTIALMDENGQRVEFQKGLGTHAQSEIAYNLEGQNYQRFESYVGIDYVQVAQGNVPSSVTFRVLVDGEERFNSGEMTVDSPMQKVSVDIRGARTIQLFADMGVNNFNDHADWADAKFIRPLEQRPSIPVTGVVLNRSDAQLAVGDTLSLEATIQPGNASNKAVTWSSDNEAIATVDENGMVTALANGTAVITVTTQDGSFTDTCTVTVAAAEAPDTTLLQKIYDYALEQDTSNLIDTVAKLFQEAMEQAQAILEHPENATQEMVEKACDDLLTAIHLLDFTRGDKAALELLIERADGMMDNANKYVEANWKQLVDALEAAKVVMEDGDAMQGDVDQAAQALLDAILAQRYKADKSILEDLIGKAENLNLEGYTADSVAAFRTALASAQAVLADHSLSEDDQATVDNAVTALSAAMDGLTAAGTPEATDQPQTTQKPETSVPQTGDTNAWLLPTVTLMAAVGALALLIFQRRRYNH